MTQNCIPIKKSMHRENLSFTSLLNEPSTKEISMIKSYLRDLESPFLKTILITKVNSMMVKPTMTRPSLSSQMVVITKDK